MRVGERAVEQGCNDFGADSETKTGDARDAQIFLVVFPSPAHHPRATFVRFHPRATARSTVLGRALASVMDVAGSILVARAPPSLAARPFRGSPPPPLARGRALRLRASSSAREEWRPIVNGNTEGTRADRRAQTRGLQPPEGVAFEDFAIGPKASRVGTAAPRATIHPSIFSPPESPRGRFTRIAP